METAERLAMLEPRQVLVLSVHEYAARLQMALGEHIEDAPEGIYIKGQLLPVLKPNVAYYTEDSYRTQTPLQSLDEVTTAVLDENGQVVIPAFVMQNQKRLLSKTATMPVQEAMIIKTFVESYLESICPHKENGRYRTRLYRHFKESGGIYVNDGTLDRALETLQFALSDFVGDDVWHIYFVKLANSEIIVEKTIDYRIFDWTERTSNGDWQLGD